MKQYLIDNEELMREWDWEANEGLNPNEITCGSHKKVWWKCPKCGYKRQQAVTKHKNCSICKEKTKQESRNLIKTYPNLIKEWHPTKNGDLTPENVTYACNKSVWWKCEKCGYEWKAKVGNRTLLNRGCPCCSNHIVVAGINDLATTHPNIAKEWHPTRNKSLAPKDVTHGSGKKVWWICPQGHEYQATVLHRTQNNNATSCPVCYSGRQTSFAEQAVFYYIKKLYPDAINRYTAKFLGKMELDVFIPSIKYAIEYDGEAWHKENKLKREQKKYQMCHEQGITLIRLREKMSELASDIADYQWSTPKLYEHKNLEHIIKDILLHLNFHKRYFIDVNIKRDYYEILKYNTVLKTDSFQSRYPDIAKEWHPTKNEKITPNMFKAHSNHKAWWICPLCNYEYEASINHRVSGTGCPKCGIEKVTRAKRKEVQMINPDTNAVICTFISISDASRKMHINCSNISMCCNGIRPTAGGYIWRYVD